MTVTEEPRAETLRFQGAANRIVRGLLRTPGLGRLAGRRLLAIYVVGRKTGRRYVIPVAYTPHEGALLVGTPFGWARNLRTGEPVQVRWRGRRRTADVEVVRDEAGVVDGYGVIAHGNRQFANFNRISLDEHGAPAVEDLHRCWRQGARVLRLQPR
jgi:deazaflavin-dependent oxidoreductase (nitroreductase family)